MTALPLPTQPPPGPPDKTLRIGHGAHEKLTTFVKALELHEFAEHRRVRRVAQSEAIEWLLDQPEARDLLLRFEETLVRRLRDRRL